MRNFFLIFKMDIKEFIRSKWFLVYFVLFSSIVALFFTTGVIESRLEGFSGLSRLLLIYIKITIIILPIFILVNTVRTIASERDNNVLEYLLSFPISLKDYYFGRFFGRLVVVTLPVVSALILAIVWGSLKGADIPWAIFVYFTAMIVVLNINFLGISFLVSSLVKSQEVALGIAFGVWLFLLAFIDILLIGMLSRELATPEIVYAISLLNPLQVFRLGAMSLFDPDLAVIGVASYFVIEEFGKYFLSIYSLIYPLVFGSICAVLGFVFFKRRDLV